MRLWIGLYLPQLPLEVFSPNWSADSGSVVLEQERVLALSPAARAAPDVISTRSCSRTTLPLSADQFGLNTSSGSWGSVSPIQSRMALQ